MAHCKSYLFLGLNKLVYLVLLCLWLVLSTNSHAKSDTDNLAQGLIQYQAGRVENIVLENVINKIRTHYSFQILFPITSRELKELESLSAKRLLPLVREFIKRDFDNFDSFIHCVVKQMNLPGQDYSRLYSSIKFHFDHSHSGTKDAYRYSVVTYLSNNQCDTLITDTDTLKKSLDQLAANLKNPNSQQSAAVLAGHAGAWVRTLQHSKDLNQKIGALQWDVKDQAQMKSFVADILNGNGNYWQWLIKQSKGKPNGPNSYQITDLITLNENIFKKAISSEARYSLINPYTETTNEFEQGQNALESSISNRSFLSPLESCQQEQLKIYFSCKMVNVALTIQELHSFNAQSTSKALKLHYFLKIVDTFNMLEKYQENRSQFESIAFFLADLIDSSKINGANKAADAVERAIASFIDEGRVYIDKRKSKGCRMRSYYRIPIPRACWFRNSLYVSSYFGMNGLITSDSKFETNVRAFGPVGFEFKVTNLGRFGVLGINYAPIDIGNAITNEVQGSDEESDLETFGSQSVFFALTLKQAPVSFLVGQQFDVIDVTGKKQNVHFIGISLDLPLITIY